MVFILDHGGKEFLETILSIRNNMKREKHASVPVDDTDIISLDHEIDEEGGDTIGSMVAGNEKSPLQIAVAESNRVLREELRRTTK